MLSILWPILSAALGGAPSEPSLRMCLDEAGFSDVGTVLDPRDLEIAVRARVPGRERVVVGRCDGPEDPAFTWRISVAPEATGGVRLRVHGTGLETVSVVPTVGLPRREASRLIALGIVEAVRPAWAVRLGHQDAGGAQAEISKAIDDVLATPIVAPPRGTAVAEQAAPEPPPRVRPQVALMALAAGAVSASPWHWAPEVEVAGVFRSGDWVATAGITGNYVAPQGIERVRVRSTSVGAQATLGFGPSDLWLGAGAQARQRTFSVDATEPDVSRTTWVSRDLGAHLLMCASPWSHGDGAVQTTVAVRAWARPRSLAYRDTSLAREPTVEVVVGLGGTWSLW